MHPCAKFSYQVASNFGAIICAPIFWKRFLYFCNWISLFWLKMEHLLFLASAVDTEEDFDQNFTVNSAESVNKSQAASESVKKEPFSRGRSLIKNSFSISAISSYFRTSSNKIKQRLPNSMSLQPHSAQMAEARRLVHKLEKLNNNFCKR